MRRIQPPHVQEEEGDFRGPTSAFLLTWEMRQRDTLRLARGGGQGSRTWGGGGGGLCVAAAGRSFSRG